MAITPTWHSYMYSTSLAENHPKTYLNQISLNSNYTYFKTVQVRLSFIRYIKIIDEVYLQAIEIDKTGEITGQI